MRHFIFTVLFSLCSFVLMAQSLQWTVVQALEPYPTSFLSIWQASPGSSTITVIYSGTATTDFKVRVTLKNSNNKELLKSTSPLETFASGPNSKVYTGSDVFSWSDVKFDNTTMLQILRSNRFPEGAYIQKVEVFASNGTTLLAESTGGFTIVYPDSPVLFGPANQSTVDYANPVFSWATINLPATVTGNYKLKIVEKLPGQTPTQALSVNPDHHAAVLINAGNYVYPQDAFALVNGKEYVWRVRVVDDNDIPLSTNDGNSEFWTFTYSNPNAPGFVPPFTRIDLARNVAWFTDFENLNMISSGDNFIYNGTTTLKLKLNGGETIDLTANVENLTFPKNQSNPSTFSGGRVTANIPANTLPANITGNYFNPSGLEFTSSDGLFIKGTVSIPNGTTSVNEPISIPVNANGSLQGIINSINTESNPVISFGNSAIKVNLASYKLVFPGGVISYTGKVVAFNDKVLSSFNNLSPNSSGNLTANIASQTPVTLDAVPAAPGRFTMKFSGASGSFSYDVTNGASSINVTLSEPKFDVNVSGLFEKPLTGSASFAAGLNYNSTEPNAAGLQVQSISSFTTTGVPFSENGLKFSNSHRADVSTLRLDVLTATNESFDFQMSLTVTHKFTGLSLYISPIEDVKFTKRGIALPALTGATVQSETNSGNSRMIDGFQVTFQTATSNVSLWTGGNSTQAMTLNVNVRLAGLPVGSSEDLFQLDLPLSGTVTRNGLTLDFPNKTFTSSHIALPGGLKFLLKEWQGSITGTVTNGEYGFTSELAVKGSVSLPENIFGNSEAHTWDLGNRQLRMNAKGQLYGSVTGATGLTGYKNGIFPVGFSNPEIEFQIVENVQKIYLGRSSRMNLEPLTGTSQDANVQLRYEVTGKQMEIFTGSYNSPAAVNLSPGTSGFSLNANSINIQQRGMLVNGRTTVAFNSNETTPVTADGLRFRYSNGKVDTGKIIFDKGIGITANVTSMNGVTANAVYSVGLRRNEYTSGDGVAFNTPLNSVYTSEGLTLTTASGSDTAYLRFKGLNYRVDVSYSNVKTEVSPFKVISGYIYFKINGTIVGVINKDRFNIYESRLPTLPEYITLLTPHIGTVKIKEGTDYLVDYTYEGNQIRVQTRPGQPVKASFKSLSFGNQPYPEIPVSFNVLLNTSGYSVASGEISADIPAGNLEKFDLTAKGIPAKLKSFKYSKSSSGLYTLTFGTIVSILGMDMNTLPIDMPMSGNGTFGGEFFTTPNALISLSSGIDDGKIVLQADTVKGVINTLVLNTTNPMPQYEIDVAGGIRLKMSDNTYQGAGATFRFSGSSNLSQILNYRPDDCSDDKKFPVNNVSFDLSKLKISKLSYNSFTNAIGYILLMTAKPEITSKGFTIRTPREVEDIILDNSIGMKLPAANYSTVESEAETFRLNGFAVKIMQFTSYGKTVRTLSNAKPNQMGFAFQLSVSCPDFPENFPARLKGLKFYVQTALYGENDALSGDILSTTLSGYRKIPFAATGAGFQVNKVSGRLDLVNDQQTISLNASGEFALPALMRADPASDGLVSFAQNVTVSLNSKGLLTGTLTDASFANQTVSLKRGKVEFNVSNKKLILAIDNNRQTAMFSGNASVKLFLNGQSTVTANGNGLVFDVVSGTHTSGSVNFQNITIGLPFNSPVFEFGLTSATLQPDGLLLNGGGNLKAGTEQKGVTFSNWKLNTDDFGYTSGSVAFPTAFRLAVTLQNSLLQWSVVPTAYTLSTAPAVVMNIPANSATLTDKIIFTGEGTVSARDQNGAEDGLRLVYEGAPEIRFSDFAVTKGSLSFYRANDKTGFINNSGLTLTNIGSNVPENLILGAMANGYIKLREGSTEYVQKDEATDGLRIRNKSGQTLQMFVPGLQYGDATVPVFNVTLDVVINKTTGALVSGTINHTAAAGQFLKDLSPKGIPFKVKSLKYGVVSEQYRLSASGVTALPAVLSALETDINDVWFSNGKLTGFRNSGTITQSYSTTSGYQKIAVIGPMATFKMQAAEYQFGDNASYKISGDISSKLFKGTGSDTSYIHFTASYVDNQFAFTLTPATSDGLTIGKFKLTPAPMNGLPGISVSFSAADFQLDFNGSLLAPVISSGFNVTLAGLTVTKSTVTAEPIDITTTEEEQNFTMFASEFTIKNNGTASAVTLSYEQDLLKLGLNGSLNFMGTDLPFSNFLINSAGVMNIGGTATGSFVNASSPVVLLANRLRVNSLGLAVVNNEYNLRAGISYQLPKPATEGWANSTFDIPAGQATTGSKTLTFVDEAPGLGSDASEYVLWAGKYDVQYVGLKINFADYSSSEIQVVSAFYVDGQTTTKNIRFGSVDGGTVTPGLSIVLDNSNSWTESPEYGSNLSFTYRTIGYTLTSDNISYDTAAAGGFSWKVSGECKISMGPTITGSLTFENLEVTSGNEIKGLTEGFTGGSVSVGSMFTATLTKFGMSTTPTDIYIPDPNGEKETSGPDKGKVKTLKQPVNYFLMFGGQLTMGALADGAVDSFLVYQRRNANGSDGGTSLVISNFTFKKQDKFEFVLNLQLLSGEGSDYSMVVAGKVQVSDNAFVAVGKLAKWKGKFSAGIFLAATEGLKIRIGPVEVTGIGGGFFYNPTDSDIDLVRSLCGFTDEYTSSIKDKVAGAPVLQPPLFSIFLYGGAAIGSKEALSGKILITISNNKLMVDGRIDILNRPQEMYGLIHLEVGFTKFYVEGSLAITVKMADGNVIDANGQLQFFYYSSSNWGMVGTASLKVMKGLMNGSADFYAGDKGFFFSVEFNQGFDVWIIKVDAGFAMKMWYKPNISWGAYFRIWVDVSVLGGVAAARGEIKGVLIGAPEFILAGGASLQVRLLFISWRGDVWLKIKKDGVNAGFGKDDDVERAIAKAENMANDMLKAVQDAKADMIANKPIPTLGITPEIVAAASSGLFKQMKKARSLDNATQITQAEKDSILAWIESEAEMTKNDYDVRNILTKLTDRILDKEGSLSRTAIATTLNELNDAVNAYKTAVNDMSTSLGEYTLTIEVPSAAGPEGVEDPVGATRFTFPATQTDEPTATGPSFELNTGLVISNSTKVQSYMANADNYHDILKKNIEKIETAIASFDGVFKKANNSYLLIGDKFVALQTKVAEYNKKLAEYYFNELKTNFSFAELYRPMGEALVDDKLDYWFRQSSVRKQYKKSANYKRWGRIRTLSGGFAEPWSYTTFSSAWDDMNEETQKAENKGRARDLYITIPTNAFNELQADRKNLLATVSNEYNTKMRQINDLAAAYTSMLDVLFAKRRKMSENLFEVTERFIYWKDKDAKNIYDKTVDFKNIAPTLTQLKTKRIAILASNTAPDLSITSSSTMNNKYFTEVNLSWAGTHPDGIVEYSIASDVWSSSTRDNISLPFRTLSKAKSITLYEFNDGIGEQYKNGEFRIRARSGSGFTIVKKIDLPGIRMGFADANINSTSTTVNNNIPPDNTPPYMFNRAASGDARQGLWPSDLAQVEGVYLIDRDGNNPPLTLHFITNKKNEIRISFTAVDNESGISSYEYQITKRNLNNELAVVRDWTNVGAINEYLIQGLDLQHCEEYVNEGRWRARLTDPSSYNFGRYVVAVRSVNGAGLKSKPAYIAVVVDETTPPKIGFTTMTASTNFSAGSPSTVQFLNSKIALPLPTPTPEWRNVTLFFPFNRPSYEPNKYIYQVYALPDNIPVFAEPQKDLLVYEGRRNNVSYLGKLVNIPPAFQKYKQFRLEMAYSKLTGAVSPLDTSSRHIPLVYTANGGDIYDSRPEAPEVYWFSGIPPGQQGSYPNGNINLFFKSLGYHKQGLLKYQYSIQDESGSNFSGWKDLPPIPEDRILRLDETFFAGTGSWLKPGKKFEINIRPVGNNNYAYNWSRVNQIVMPLKSPTVQNFSVDIVKKTAGNVSQYSVVVNMINEPVATAKSYKIRTEQFVNGRWITPAGGNSRVFHSIPANGTPSRLDYDLASGQFTTGMMPVRQSNASGTGYITGGEIWRIYIKSVDADGNESPEVMKEMVW